MKIALWICIILSSALHTYAQNPGGLSNEEYYNSPLNWRNIDNHATSLLRPYTFKPVEKYATAYTAEGKSFKLNENDEVTLLYIKSGKFKDYSGIWLEFTYVGHGKNVPDVPGGSYYVPFEKMMKIAPPPVGNRIKRGFETSDYIYFGIFTLLGIIVFLMLKYGAAPSTKASTHESNYFFGNGRFRYGKKDVLGHNVDSLTGEHFNSTTGKKTWGRW